MPAHIVVMPLTDRLPIFELAVPCEVFGIDRADLVNPWYDLRFCASEPGSLGTSSGPGIHVPYDLTAMDQADTIILPACSRQTQLNPPADLISALQRAHRRGTRLVSICTGAYLLAASGLLDGRRATTHWMNVVDFAHRFPQVKVDGGVLFVDEGDILTSAGTGAAVDVCLHLVATDHGTAVAHTVARRMVVPPHRDGTQAQFVEPPTGLSRADELGPVLEWARQNLTAPLTVADLARRANMSQRTFARRFQEITGVSPLRWVLQQRIRCAQELLETTDESIEKVAQRAGFSSAATLRLHFQRAVAVPPQTYRHVFRTSRQRAL